MWNTYSEQGLKRGAQENNSCGMDTVTSISRFCVAAVVVDVPDCYWWTDGVVVAKKELEEHVQLRPKRIEQTARL